MAQARDAAIACVRDAYAAGRPLHGWEVDAAGRRVIDEAGHGKYFIHRIGHNIGQEVHGNGANMDNLETHDERLVLRRTCFSIEPGHLLRRVRSPERGERLRRRKRGRSRHRRLADRGIADLEGVVRSRLELPGQDSNLEKQDQNLL